MAVEESKRDRIIRKLQDLKANEFSNAEAIVDYASELRDMTFEEVLALELSALLPSNTYSDTNRKGAVGNLLEEHYFGYTINSDSEPDFPNAGLELKVSPIDYGNNRKKEWVIKAGERLVLTMIPNHCEIPIEYDKSPLEKKASDILLISYLRDRNATKTEQIIKLINRLKISDEDLEIIREDYRKIVQLIQEGRAHELSEGMTNYLGACTKGATAKKSIAKQFYPYTHADGSQEYIPAKRRAFSFKQSYMTSLVQRLEKKQREADYLLKDRHTLKGESFDEFVLQMLAPHQKRYAQDLAEEIAPDLDSQAKNFLNALTWRIFGSKNKRIEEFEKAGIALRTIRVQKNGKIKEKLKLRNFKFKELHNEKIWEESSLYSLLMEQRYLFVVYQENDQGYFLRGAFFWSAPTQMIGGKEFKDNKGTAYEYWLDTKRKLKEGVTLHLEGGTYKNNFMKSSENPICHIRPSAKKAAYRFTDGRPDVGNVERDANQLPDGQWMTSQAFWLNTDLLKQIIKEL